MTKSEIVELLSQQSGMRKKDVLYIVDNFLDKIKASISQGDKVEIRGFGTFYQIEKKARRIYSPIAKKNIDVPSKVSLAFKASKSTEVEIPTEVVENKEGA